MCAVWQRQDVCYQLLVVLVISDEVNLCAINYQQFGIRVVVKKLHVGAVQLVQILGLYHLLCGDTSFLNSLQQDLCRCLKIDHKIGLGCVNDKMLINLVVQVVFVFFQIQFRKKPVFVDKEVRDPDRLE